MGAIEFSIDRADASEAAVCVDGRNCGGRLAVGDVFTRAARDGGRDARPVTLRVRSIEAYGRLLDELSSGMTARLTLVGDLGPALDKGDVLAG